MEQPSHPDAKGLKLSKTTKGLRSIFKTNLCGKKSCDNKQRLKVMLWLRKRQWSQQHKTSSPQSEGAALKCLPKKNLFFLNHTEKEIVEQEEKHKNPFCYEKKKKHAGKEGGLDDLFYCHQKTYVCTELRITVTKASGKSRKKKVANTHKVICKTKKQSQSKNIQLDIHSCPKP